MTGRRYTLIDTAGMRRRGKVEEVAEKFSVVKTLQSIEDANVVILVLDAVDGDLRAGRAYRRLRRRGRARAGGRGQQVGRPHAKCSATQVKRDLDAQARAFLGFARCHFISALQRSGASAGCLNHRPRPPMPPPWRSCRRRALTRVLMQAAVGSSSRRARE